MCNVRCASVCGDGWWVLFAKELETECKEHDDPDLRDGLLSVDEFYSAVKASGMQVPYSVVIPGPDPDPSPSFKVDVWVADAVHASGPNRELARCQGWWWRPGPCRKARCSTAASSSWYSASDSPASFLCRVRPCDRHCRFKRCHAVFGTELAAGCCLTRSLGMFPHIPM